MTMDKTANMLQALQRSSDRKHQDIHLVTSRLSIFVHLYLLSPKEHIINVDIGIYFKKRQKQKIEAVLLEKVSA